MMVIADKIFVIGFLVAVVATAAIRWERNRVFEATRCRICRGIFDSHGANCPIYQASLSEDDRAAEVARYGTLKPDRR